jgi:dCMP deaminase
MRIPKIDYYINIARVVSERGTCLRRNYGAVIVASDDHIVSTGYSGSPRGARNCCEGDECPRNAAGCKPGEGYELCCSVHAEQNAIIKAAPDEMIGATMYVSGAPYGGDGNVDCEPCCLCRRMILNSGIAFVVFSTSDGSITKIAPADWISDQRLSTTVSA